MNIIKCERGRDMKKLISLLLALTLVWGLLPRPAAAVEGEAGDPADSWRYCGGLFTGGDAPQLNADAYHPDATLQGIDVSEHQGQINWDKVKAAGIDFAIIRCGYGMDQTDQDDKYFEYNASECERVGIPYGVYIYSYADTVARAESEAAHVLRLIQGHTLSYPVYFDMEDNSTLDGDLAAIATAFCNIISDAGYPVGVYSNLYWWTTYLTDPCFEKWYRWMAQYYTSCSYQGEYAMWQYSSSGSVDGISGRVDMNYQIGWPADHGVDTDITLTTDKVIYETGDPIYVTTNYRADGAWVGLYKRGERYGETGAKSIFWYYVFEEMSPVNILETRDENGRAGEFGVGEYTVVLFRDGGYTGLKTVNIRVTPTVVSQTRKEPTCTEDGSITVTYSDGSTEVISIPELGHQEEVIPGREATCAQTGLTEGKKCSVCGTVLVQQQEIPSGAHVWDEGVVTKRPTSTQNGEMRYTCQVCGDSYTQPIYSSGQPYIARLSGTDRFDTAIKVAEELTIQTGRPKFDAVILASGTSFADALGGSYLAAVKNAPILLSYTDVYNLKTADYIRNNLAPGGTVYILGGTAAVSASMEDMLMGLKLKRLAGADRYETNLLILKEAGVTPGQKILVCTGSNFADSLSGSATGMPILMVNNASGTLSGNQKAFLENLGASFCIVGGEGAVSRGLEEALRQYGAADRLAGADRFATSVLVANTFFDAPANVVLAYAGNFPDGLCGGALAYGMGAPLILTMTGRDTMAAAYAKGNGITQGIVLGGGGLIADSTVRWILSMNADQSIEVK